MGDKGIVLKEYELNHFKLQSSRRTLKHWGTWAGCALPRRCALGQRSYSECWEDWQRSCRHCGPEKV